MKNKPGRSDKLRLRLVRIMALVANHEGIKKRELVKLIAKPHENRITVRDQVCRDQNVLVAEHRLFVQIDQKTQRFYTPDYAKKNHIPAYIAPPEIPSAHDTTNVEMREYHQIIGLQHLTAKVWRPVAGV